MPTSTTATVASSVPCPVVESLDAILPEEPLLMMGAGPVPIPAAVAKANAIVINHLGGTMAKVVNQVKTMARYVFQTQSKWVLGVAGPGSGAMEMAISNLAWEGTRMLCIRNGFFSDRMGEMGRRVGAHVSCSKSRIARSRVSIRSPTRCAASVPRSSRSCRARRRIRCGIII
jgi:alanine-glyoxylate transaminase/serine-glyoxylate transaminase/serine-pyruvate transaminase